MANWAESVCLRCGSRMVTLPCAVCTQPTWLDEYPAQVRWSIGTIEGESEMPFKYHVSRCQGCGTEVLIAVNDPYCETADGRVAVRFMGEYRIVSDEVVSEREQTR